MSNTRIIPTLLLRDGAIVKTKQFSSFQYVGDPCNTVQVFNELEADELIVLDIDASKNKKKVNFDLLKDIADECFMPITYGGGIDNFEMANKILRIGFEKIAVNSAAHINPSLITDLSNTFGSQAVLASIDVRKINGDYHTFSHSGTINHGVSPLEQAKIFIENGAGELMITSIDNEGTWQGFDLTLLKQITDEVDVPVIAHGGAGSVQHLCDAVNKANVSAVALGSMLVYQKKDMGVLINYPHDDFSILS